MRWLERLRTIFEMHNGNLQYKTNFEIIQIEFPLFTKKHQDKNQTLSSYKVNNQDMMMGDLTNIRGNSPTQPMLFGNGGEQRLISPMEPATRRSSFMKTPYRRQSFITNVEKKLPKVNSPQTSVNKHQVVLNEKGYLSSNCSIDSGMKSEYKASIIFSGYNSDDSEKSNYFLELAKKANQSKSRSVSIFSVMTDDDEDNENNEDSKDAYDDEDDKYDVIRSNSSIFMSNDAKQITRDVQSYSPPNNDVRDDEKDSLRQSLLVSNTNKICLPFKSLYAISEENSSHASSQSLVPIDNAASFDNRESGLIPPTLCIPSTLFT